MPTKDLDTFFNHFIESINRQQFVKLTLSDRRDKNNELKNIFIKPVVLKSGLQLSFVYRYPTKDITKNYTLRESLTLLLELLDKDFYKADLFTTANDIHLGIAKNGTSILKLKSPTFNEIATTEHDQT